MRVGAVLVLVAQLVLIALALRIVHEQRLVQENSLQIAYNLSPEGRWHNALTSASNAWATASNAVVNVVTGARNKANTQEIEAMRDLLGKIDAHQRQSYYASWALAGCIVLMAVVAFAVGRVRLLSLHLLLSSMILFVVGVVTVMVYVTVSKEVWLIGDIVWQHDAKGLLQTVQSLWRDDIWLATVIALFSIVLPLVKFMVTLSVFVTDNVHSARKRLGYMQHIGKWSMADVFALGMVISFFTFNRLRMTDAHVGMGIYLFVAYVLLAMLATVLLARSFRA